MLDLFGSQVPLAVRFFIAFAVVLGLIGVTAWLVRRFGAGRLGGAGGRGRQPRLAVIDGATIDSRRRLVLIRRDNIEHLLMIGGPTDVVIESNIVRAATAREGTREGARPTVGPGLVGVEGPSAPAVQPPSEPAPVSSPRPAQAPEPAKPDLVAHPRPAEATASGKTGAAETVPETRHEPLPASPPMPAEPPLSPQADRNLAAMAQQLESALRRSPAQEGHPPVTDPLVTPPAAPPTTPSPVRPEAPTRPPAREFRPRAEPTFDAEFDSKFDFNPEPKVERPPEPRFEPRLAPQPVPQPAPRPEQKPQARPQAKPAPPAASGKKLYDNLEEEMASLLGRPPGKS